MRGWEAVAVMGVTLACAGRVGGQEPPYPWLQKYDAEQSIEKRIAPPAGFQRIAAGEGSYAKWLRGLPCKKGEGVKVHLYDGREKANQTAHAAVLDVDVGEKDLQQCADVVIRLRAEYLFERRQYDKVRFQFTSGDEAAYEKWAEGFRPRVEGNRVSWEKQAGVDRSYAGFRSYLDTVFTYAGTMSLSRQLEAVADPGQMRIGDVFVKGGSPGHAVTVVDMAANERTGRKVFLLVQGFMPAQEMHVLRNPSDATLSPWYDLNFGEVLRTPEWTFKSTELKRFP